MARITIALEGDTLDLSPGRAQELMDSMFAQGVRPSAPCAFATDVRLAAAIRERDNYKCVLDTYATHEARAQKELKAVGNLGKNYLHAALDELAAARARAEKAEAGRAAALADKACPACCWSDENKTPSMECLYKLVEEERAAKEKAERELADERLMALRTAELFGKGEAELRARVKELENHCTVCAARPFPQPHKCPVCDGSGKISTYTGYGRYGGFTCMSCDGSGIVWSKP